MPPPELDVLPLIRQREIMLGENADAIPPPAVFAVLPVIVHPSNVAMVVPPVQYAPPPTAAELL